MTDEVRCCHRAVEKSERDAERVMWIILGLCALSIGLLLFALWWQSR